MEDPYGTLAKRVKAARKHWALTQDQVAKATDGEVSQSDISKIERGTIQKSTGLIALARALRCDPNWLDTGNGSPDWGSAGNPQKKIVHQEASNVGIASARKTVPLISWIKAGSWGDVLEIRPEEAEDWVDAYETNPGDQAFALRVMGDSMTSPYPTDKHSFPDGTIIIVDPARAANAGDFVVAKDVTTQKATFKCLAHDGGRWYLKPLNPSYPIIEIDDPAIRVIGRVIEYRRGGKL